MPDLPAFCRIGDAAELVGVAPHVLRYWEDEFAKWVRPSRSKKGQRVYSRRTVETLIEIKRLLYVELYTIRGAKRRMAGRGDAEGVGEVG
jgi:DNA-binding transcriptional MerR regulator